MMAAVSKKHSPPVTNKPVVTDKPSTKIAKTLPSFMRHFKATNASDATIFKVGYSKGWKGETWYFCDCTNHRDHIKWHPHPDPECRTCQKWLNDKNGAPAAAIVDDQGSEVTDLTNATASINSSEIYSLLAAAMSLAAGNKEVTAYISDALNALHDLGRLCHGLTFFRSKSLLVSLYMQCPWLFYYITFVSIVHLHLRRPSWRTSREIPIVSLTYRQRKFKDPLYLSPMLLSVNYYDALILSSHLVLSDTHIPIQWCPPTVQ